MAVSASLASCSSDAPPNYGTPGSPVGQYSGLLTASEYIAGDDNRFAFRLINVGGEELRSAQVSVAFYRLDGNQRHIETEADAVWHEVQGVSTHVHPDGELHVHHQLSGIYVVNPVVLREPGIWEAELAITLADRPPPQLQRLAFQVVRSSEVPNQGELVPATQNLTMRDVQRFSDLSTRTVPDGMHQLSVAQALIDKRPFVVLFASPQFCVSHICGPLADMVASVHETFRDEVNFIHIEPWDLAAARTEGRLVPGNEMVEWGLTTEPWLFVVQSDGRVFARFEGMIGEEELTAALGTLLAASRRTG